MLANFLNKSKPINYIGMLFLFLIAFIGTLFYGDSIAKVEYLFFLESIVFILIFLFVIFIFNFITKKNRLTFDNSYAFFFFIILLISILPDILNFRILILCCIYLLILRKTYSLKSIKKIYEKTFDASFWLGVFFILEPNSIIFVFFLFIGIYIHKKASLNSFLIPFIGFASPLIIYFTYLFWIDKLEEFYNLFKFKFNFDFQNYYSNKLFFLFLIIFMITVISILIKSRSALSVNNSFKRNWILLILNFFIPFIFLYSNDSKSYENFIFIIFPSSIILANGIELINKKFFRDILLYFFLFGVFIFRFLL